MTDSQDLARLMAEFGKAYTRRIWTEMEQAGTTPARARLLLVLQCRGACKMTEVGAQLAVTPRNVTKLVDGLESEGLVMREAHPHDRRAVLLRLTPRGTQVCKESALANHGAIAGLYEQLESTDRQHLGRILGQLLAVLKQWEADEKEPDRKRD